MAKQYKGSYGILSRSSGVTAAKIVIYQPNLGHENGVLPFLKDGIYVLVRTGEEAGQAIWKSSIVQLLDFAERLSPDSTVGIAPMHDRRFAYFEVTDRGEHDRIAETPHCTGNMRDVRIRCECPAQFRALSCRQSIDVTS